MGPRQRGSTPQGLPTEHGSRRLGPHCCRRSAKQLGLLKTGTWGAANREGSLARFWLGLNTARPPDSYRARVAPTQGGVRSCLWHPPFNAPTAPSSTASYHLSTYTRAKGIWGTRPCRPWGEQGQHRSAVTSAPSKAPSNPATPAMRVTVVPAPCTRIGSGA